MDGVNAIDLALAGVLAPILTGLGEVAKRSLGVPARLVPAINVVLGIVLAVGYTWLTHAPAITGGMWAVAILTGVVVGLTSAQIYDGARALDTRPEAPLPPRG